MEKFNEATLPEKEEIYSNLNMEDITDADYKQAKKVCKDFEIKKIGWMWWFVSQKWYITFGWYFQKFQKNQFKNLSFRFCKTSFSSCISMASIKDWSKVELLSDIDMLIMVERGIKEGILNFFCKKTIFFLSLHFLNNARNEAKIFLMFFLTFMSVFSLII